MDKATQYKKIYLAGIAAYAVLFVFAILFYKERIVSADAALHLFAMLRSGTFEVQASRFGTVLTQIGPLLASKLHLSLATVVLSYSVNYILTGFICYLLCGFVFKNYRYGVIILLCSTLIVSNSFYLVQSEILQGIPLVCAVLGYITIKKKEDISIIAALLLVVGIITIAFIHPLTMFMVLFAAAYHLVNKDTLADKRLFFLSISLFIVAFIIKQIAFSNSYDTQAQSNVVALVQPSSNYFNTPSAQKFLEYCIDKYYLLPVLTAGVALVYALQKRWMSLLLLLISVAGYITIVMVSHPAAMSDGYAETMYIPVSFIIALPFVYDALPLLHRYHAGISIVMLIVVLGIVRIYNTKQVYVKRLDWERQFMKDNDYRKILIADDKVPMDVVMYTWSTPYECLLLSTIETGKPASVYVSDDIDKHLNAARWDNKVLLTPWGSVDYNDMPKTYFNFTDTSLYTVIK